MEVRKIRTQFMFGFCESLVKMLLIAKCTFSVGGCKKIATFVSLGIEAITEQSLVTVSGIL